jgi:hypothetical protein
MTRIARLLIPLVFLAAGCVVAPAAHRTVRPASIPPLTSEDITRMSKAGVSDSIIVEKLKADGIAARPTADQIVSLMKEGVSDRVLEAMLAARVLGPAELSAREAYVEAPEHGYSYPYYSPAWGYDACWWSWPYPWWFLWNYPRTWQHYGPRPGIRSYRP